MNVNAFFSKHRETVLEVVRSQVMKSSPNHLTGKDPLTLVSPGFSPLVCAHFSYHVLRDIFEK